MSHQNAGASSANHFRGKLVTVTAAEVGRQEQAWIDARDERQASVALLTALQRLAQREADQLGVPCLDRTYHRCDPLWRDALNAAADLAEVVLGVRCWGVPVATVLGSLGERGDA